MHMLALFVAVVIDVLAVRQIGQFKLRGLTIAGIYQEQLKSRKRLPASAYSWSLLALTVSVAAVWYNIHG